MSGRPFRSFAIIPAAGSSRRMGRHKLLLPVSEGDKSRSSDAVDDANASRTMFEHVLDQWLASDVDEVCVVVRHDDRPLQDICRARTNVHLVIPPAAPPDMKASVQFGLRHVQAQFSPTQDDVWLLAPADMPKFSAAITTTLLADYQTTLAAPDRKPQIIVPTIGGKRGHPVLFSWPLFQDVLALPADQGVNQLLKQKRVREVPVADASILEDCDTPADYRRLTGRLDADLP